MVVTKNPASPDYRPEVDDGDKVDIPTPNARQGVTDHNVRYVLALSVAGAVILVGIAYLVFFGFGTP
jgi:hypothetical protein